MARTKALMISIFAGAVAATLVTGLAFADDHGFGGGFGGGFGRHRRGEGMFLLFPLLLLLAVVALVAVLWKGRHPGAFSPPPPPVGPPPSPTLNAQAILADRLARGEISPDDYRAAIAVLREPPPTPVSG